MNNIIITIIGIALAAIIAITGAYYGGQAFQQGQINAIATSIINEAVQINTAQRFYALNNGQPDATGANFNTLVSGKELAEYPSVISQLGVNLGTAFGYEEIYGNCYNYSGYQGPFGRQTFTYNNGNYVYYNFGYNYPYTAPCTSTNSHFSASSTNHPIVQIAAAINSSLKNTSPSATMLNGIPLLTSSKGIVPYSGLGWFANGFNNTLGPQFDGNGNVLTNQCYYNNGNPNCCTVYIVCVFGPS